MATLADLKKTLIYVLGDQIDNTDPVKLVGKQYKDNDVLVGGINAGIDAILPWVPKASVATLTTDGVVTEFDLPTDLYRIEAVWDATSKSFLSLRGLTPSVTWKDAADPLSYIEYPEGHLSFSYAPAAAGVNVYYGARWTKVVLDTDTITPPVITHYPLVLFAASHATLSKSSLASVTRQYISKTADAGTPMDNPLLQISTYFRKLFDAEMSRHPARQRGQR